MKRLMTLGLFMAIMIFSQAQIAINEDGSPADTSAMLDVKSTTKGLLVPRMTTQQQKDISGPSAGLIIFNTDVNDFYGFNGNSWISFSDPNDSIYIFTCGKQLIDERDMKMYPTVDINGQCWMASNLNIGSIITSGDQSDNGVIEKYCYQNSSANCTQYGGMYQWPEMMQYSTNTIVQGICPDGWHVPTESEWCAMTTYVDATVTCGVYSWTGTDIGTKLKSTSGWSSSGNGTDAVGFNGKPGGIRTNYGSFFDLGYYGYWWSSGQAGSSSWNRRITSYQNDMGSFYNTNTYATTVRCIQD